jgi:hypothetical protein
MSDAGSDGRTGPAEGAGPPAGEPAASQPAAQEPSARRGGGLRTLIPVALILLAALIQIMVNLPGGTESSTPYSAETCEFLFPGPHGEFRIACQKGAALPK